jgi:hypothetical protein
MQIDLSSHGMRIRGKAWEVRAKLRDLAQSEISLHEFLYRQTRNVKNNIVHLKKV